VNISEAARSSGLTSDAIRFYEREGVLPLPPRAANGYRRYTEQHVAALRLARRLRDLDVGLDDVAAVIEVAHSASCGDLREELASSLEQTEVRIRELRETRVELRRLVGALEEMSPADESVPGLVACECVQLATGG